jgi:hypothetical protein
MSKQLTVKQEQSLEVPDWAKENDGAEDFITLDIKISQIYLTQQMSDAASKGSARPGEFVDSVTGENFGKELDFIVLKKYVEWIAFKPKNTDDTLKWAEGETMKRSTNGKTWSDGQSIDPDMAWKYEQYKYYVLVRGKQSLPSVLSFKNTSKKAGKDLANLLFRFTNINREPIYARSYKLVSDSIKNDKGNFFAMRATVNEGFISDEEAKTAKDFRAFIESNSHIVEEVTE